jgi:putative membrane protein
MMPVASALMLLLAGSLDLVPIMRKVLGMPPPYGVSPAATLALFGFSLIHGYSRLGRTRLGVLLLSTFVVTFGMEAISIATKLVGAYEYTAALGPRVLGVPLLIPAAWLMMLYPTLLTVETILGAPPIREVRDRRGAGAALGWAAAVSLIVAFAMTAWDIGAETIIVITGEYTWKDGGSYFGVPIPNFVGWVATSFAAAFAFLAWEIASPPRSRPSQAAPEWQPIAAYLLVILFTFLGNLVLGNRAATLITTFVMMPYVLIAAVRLLGSRLSIERP